MKRLEPSSRRSRPRTATPTSARPAPGHFVKMVHNGIEYGLMQAYAEGFEIMDHSEFDLDLREIAGIWRYGSVVRSWLLELLYAAFEQEGADLDDIARLRRGLGRGPLDDRRGDRRERARAGDQRGALRALRLAPGRVASRPRSTRRCATSSAATRCKAVEAGRREPGPAMSTVAEREPAARGPAAAPQRRSRARSSIFGASGDLTQRKLLPALYALALRRLLPERFAVVGVARTEKTTRQFSRR